MATEKKRGAASVITVMLFIAWVATMSTLVVWLGYAALEALRGQ